MLEELKPFIEQLAREGLRGRDLTDKVRMALDLKIRHFYKTSPWHHAGRVILTELKRRFDPQGLPESKAEAILYQLLNQSGLNFKFQYKIGPYRVDYLLGKDLVLELDGPGHSNARDTKRDAYLQKMGYRVLRLPIWLLSLDPDKAIEEIKWQL